LTIGATLLVPLLAKPNATSPARTDAGNAISRHHGAIAAQRGFMLTVPNHPSIRFSKALAARTQRAKAGKLCNSGAAARKYGGQVTMSA
jgi:hypothetical protein